MSKKKPPVAEPKKPTEVDLSKMGRPPKHIDWEIAKKLCSGRHTEGTIAWHLGINVNTLARACLREQGMTFREFFDAHKDGPRQFALRELMWRMALKDEDKQVAMYLDKVCHAVQDENPNITITHLTISVDNIKNAVSTDNFLTVDAVGGSSNETK